MSSTKPPTPPTTLPMVCNYSLPLNPLAAGKQEGTLKNHVHDQNLVLVFFYYFIALLWEH